MTLLTRASHHTIPSLAQLSGTGACRLAGEFLAQFWPNHPVRRFRRASRKAETFSGQQSSDIPPFSFLDLLARSNVGQSH